MLNGSIMLKNQLKLYLSDLYFKVFGGKGEYSSLKNETAITFENELDINTCKDLIERIERIISDNQCQRVWKDTVGSDIRILGFERYISDIIEIFDIQKKIENVDKYTGKKTKSWFLMANRVVPKNKNLGSGGGMHRDSPFSNQVKCIWYLNNVGDSNGPFSYIKGTNFNIFENRLKYPVGEFRFNNIEDDFISVCAGAGTLLICDTRCIHGGKVIEDGVRYAITLYCLPKKNGAKKIFEKSGLVF